MANFQRVAIPGAIFDMLQTDLSPRAEVITAFGAIFMYVYAFSLLLIGLLVDRFSGIRVILWGGILFSIGALIFPNTKILPLLYLSRTLLGAGSACFYISLIQEVKKCFPDKYFGISVSLTLITGYLGGVCANAPFIWLLNKYNWDFILNILGMVTFFAVVIYALVLKSLHGIAQNKHVKFSIQPFKDVLSKKFNHNLFIFAGINYGMYYVIQTVIGVKFLKDFVGMSGADASIILSLMVVVAGISGVSLASLSKLFDNKRVFLMKSVCFVTTSIFVVIFLCLLLNLRLKVIAYLIMFLAIGGGMSPLLVPIIHKTNKYEERGTALSIMNCCFFLSVGFFASLSGFLLEIFKPVINKNGYTIYSSESYLLIFGMFIIFSMIEMYNVFKLKDV